MSLNRILPEEIEYFKLETNPIRNYSSSSIDGISGAINLYAMRSSAEKELYPLSMYAQSFFNDSDIEQYRKDLIQSSVGTTDIESSLDEYLTKINEQGQSLRKEQQLFVYRFVPPPSLNSNTLRKNVIRNILNPYYHNIYSKANWNTTNYNSLNFFSTSNVPTSSVLIYSNPTWQDPNSYSGDTVIYNIPGLISSSVKTQYQLSGAFTFDFWIKPTQTQETDQDPYIPGCVMHMSGGYAVTLHSGSSKDQNGLVDKYRICFQYGNETNSPSDIVEGLNVDNSALTSSFVVWSSDNILTRNKWHHVTIRYPGFESGFGTIHIDAQPDVYFSCSADLGSVGTYPVISSSNNALFVGNFYEGSSDVNEFFPMYTNGDDISYGGGGRTYCFEQSYQKYLQTTGSYPTLLSIGEASNPAPGPFYPSSFVFRHPLKAEIHELKLYDKFLNKNEITSLQKNGPGYFGRINFSNLKFYLPPFFTYESPIRSNELITPFQMETSSSSTTPFSVKLAYGVYGHSINLENYVRDFASDNYPILWDLVPETTNGTTEAIEANTFIYNSGSNIKRLYTIVPCDNGNISPNFLFLQNLNTYRFRNDLGNIDYGSISLNNIAVTASYRSSKALTQYTEETDQGIINNILGATPEEMNQVTGSSLAIAHRTRDLSSNQVVIFDISNLYYGKQIKPGSVVLTDTAISGPFANPNLIGSGENNNLGFTLKDDGMGNLYRADAIDGPYPTWSSVGNVYYNEGLITIKYPQLYFFGKNQFDLSFKGMQNIHVLTINATAYAGTLVSSSNPTFTSSIDQKPNEDLFNQADQTFVYITGINIHDENLNVIMRTNLAQPLQKLSGDKIQFRVKLDY